MRHDSPPRRMPWWIAVAVAAAGLCWSPPAARGAEVWFSVPQARPQFMSLFQPDAPWQQAASAIRVFKIYTYLVANANYSDDVLRHIFADLKRRNIALALEGELTTKPSNCGIGESYEWPAGSSAVIAERIHRLGGDLRFVAMDEPLFFGHHITEGPACHMPIADLARNVATDVAAFKHVFPDVQIGDIEPLGVGDPEWVDAIVQWTQAFKVATGQPLAFVHLDMNWGGQWRKEATELVPHLRQAGIKYGVIYDGGGDDKTDLAWTNSAERHFVEIESSAALTPDQAVVQTWSPNPVALLPETQPGTMTWLVGRYRAVPTRLVLRRAGSRLEGQLTDDALRPLVGAAVVVTAEIGGQADAPALHTITGHAPPKATAALLALRINTECGCSGPANVALGPMRFHDDRTGQTVQQAFRPPAATADTGSLARFQARPGQAIVQNASRIPVAADDAYTLQVPMNADPASAESGYVGLIFLDADGKEIERRRISFEPVERKIGTATTDPQGRFSLLPDPDTLRGSVGFQADFAGDPQHRISSAALR
jgi:hypothetical protein